jgi:hypothetical protein
MEATPRIENKTDNYLTKSPHWTHGVRVALGVDEILIGEILVPRAVGVDLRRTPKEASRKTSANGARPAQGGACGVGVIDRQVPGVTTHLIEFVF